MRYETLRIYGTSNKIGWWPTEEDYEGLDWKQKAVLRRDCQYEVNYTDYIFVDGEFSHMADGTEDFTVSRISSLTWKDIYLWKGRRQSGGKRWWEKEDTLKVRRGTAPRLIKMYYQQLMFCDYEMDVR